MKVWARPSERQENTGVPAPPKNRGRILKELGSKTVTLRTLPPTGEERVSSIDPRTKGRYDGNVGPAFLVLVVLMCRRLLE